MLIIELTWNVLGSPANRGIAAQNVRLYCGLHKGLEQMLQPVGARHAVPPSKLYFVLLEKLLALRLPLLRHSIRINFARKKEPIYSKLKKG